MIKQKAIKKNALAPTVLISHGAGFIGSYLSDDFLSKGARVVVLDILDADKKTRVDRLLKNPKYAFFEADLNEGIPDEITSVDYIIELSDFEDYLGSREFFGLDSLLTNSMGLKNLLDLSLKSEAKFLLVSTVDVLEGPTKFSIDAYLSKTSTNNDQFSACDAKKFAEAFVWEHQKKYKTDARIVRLPYVYGPSVLLDSCGYLGHMLDDLVERRNLTIYGDENHKEHYLYISDAVSGLIKSLFGIKTSGNVYSLVVEDPQKSLTTAFLLRNLADRHVDILFKKSPKPQHAPVTVPASLNLHDIDWWPKVSFKDGIVRTLQSFSYKINTSPFKAAALVEEKESEKKETEMTLALDNDVPALSTPIIPAKKPRLQITLPSMPRFSGRFDPKIFLMVTAILMAALAIFVIIPVLSLRANISAGVDLLKDTQESLTKLDLEKASLSAKKSSEKFEKAKDSFSKINWLSSIFCGKECTYSVNKLLGSVTYFSKSIYNISLASKPFLSLWDTAKPGSKATLDQTYFDESKSFATLALNNIQLSMADYKYVNTSSLPFGLEKQALNYGDYLSLIGENLNLALMSSSDVSQIFGIDKPKKYLILFQNSNEIRPTGGFIGSYALVYLDKGKITNLLIDDIYNPDGQIDVRNIKIAPPKPVKDFLKEDRLYIRNANWNPDFTESAKTISDLFFTVKGEKIDGVVAIDLYFVQELLKVSGPIFLASYNEEITSDNLYERAQYYSDFNYKQGVSEKKAFLTTLGGKLLERFFSLPTDKMPLLLTSLATSLDKKHMQVTLFNNSANIFLDTKGWNGSLTKTKRDYLYVVNANLGGTKANYYVENAYSYTINSLTRDGLLRATLDLSYKHNGQDMAWPGGPYTDYARVITQKGTRLTGAKMIKGDVSEDIFEKIVSGKSGDYDTFEFSFILDPKSSVRFVIEYDLPVQLSLTKDLKDYSLFWEKQPGTEKDSYKFKFNPPFGMPVDTIVSNCNFLDKTMPYAEGILDYNKEVNLKFR